MTILIVDDTLSTRLMVAFIVEDMGHTSVQVESGEQAVAYIVSAVEFPSLILLDVQMPGIDGYETAHQIKAYLGDRHIPIIFLTASSATRSLSKCLSVGDDFVSKPFSPDVLTARISAHYRISQLYKLVDSKNSELLKHQIQIQNEHQVVESIFRNHCQRDLMDADVIRYHISPASIFNGDVLLSKRGPSGNYYVIVGDVTGHGLAAAVSAIPVYSTFHRMAEKGLPVGTIAHEMNEGLRKLMPENMMFAATIMEINSRADTATVWSGGMPPMIIEDGSGKIKEFIRPKHAPLSVLSSDKFSRDVSLHALLPSDRIYLFTDGVEETRNEAGDMFGENRFHGIFNGKRKKIFDAIVKNLNEFKGDREQDDDITLVEIQCKPIAESVDRVGASEGINTVPWALKINLDIAQIRNSDPMVQIAKLLGNAMGLDVHQDYLSTILSELYGNALDHGLLGLSSDMKETDDGFIEYYNIRRKTLRELEAGTIEIHISHQGFVDGEACIVISITDSGRGFDFSKANSVGGENKSHGRGMNIVRALCSEVIYSNGGRSVEARYTISR